MMYACEMMAMITEKKVREEAERMAKALCDFHNHLEEIDAFVEKRIFEGEGKAKILIDRDGCRPEGFYHFADKDWRYSAVYPYWSNARASESFPLEVYVAYLRDHCYTVEVIEEPFKAYSSTLKSERMMDGLTLSISIG